MITAQSTTLTVMLMQESWTSLSRKSHREDKFQRNSLEAQESRGHPQLSPIKSTDLFVGVPSLPCVRLITHSKIKRLETITKSMMGRS